MDLPPEVTDYVILRAARDRLIGEVRGRLSDGWHLYGHPYLYSDQDTAQAMVKYRMPKPVSLPKLPDGT